MMSTALLVKGHYRCPFRSCQLHHWMTILKFWPKPIPRLFFRYQIFRIRNRYFFPKTKFSENETNTFFWDQIHRIWNRFFFFQDQILRNRYQNPPKIGKSLETETKTESSQYPWQFLERSSPNIFLLFLLCFSSPLEKKKIFSFSEYYPFSSPPE